MIVDQPLTSVTLSAPTLIFPKLKDLVIYHNVTTGMGSLKTFDIDLKNAFPALLRLDLTDNLITVLPNLADTSLRRLEMRGNRITEVPPNYLKDSSIFYLGLDFNLVQSLGPQSLYKPPEDQDDPLRIMLSFNNLKSFDP